MIDDNVKLRWRTIDIQQNNFFERKEFVKKFVHMP